MSKSSKRKITVDLNVKTKEIPKSRPSVFERLGTKASNDYCRHWAQNGTCPYGKNCKYTNTHTLVSPSKQRAAKKDGVELKKKNKDDPNKRLHSAVIIKGGGSGRTPEPEFDAWDPTDLEYADAEALEKRRQELQRQLELQLKMESKQGHKKDKKPKKRDTSSSSSGSSSSTSESTSTSDDTSSASSASSKESRRRRSKKKTKRNSSSSSDPDARKRKAASKAIAQKKTLAHVKTVVRHVDRSRAKKHPDISSPARKPAAPKTPPSKTSRSPSPKRRSSTTPPPKMKSVTPSKPNVAKSAVKARVSHSLERKDRRGTPSPRPPVRRDEKDKHKDKEREKEREREKEIEREKEREKDKEKEREKAKEREREKENARAKESAKTRGRDRSITPKKDSRSGKETKKKDSPDSGNSRDRNRVSSPGRSHGPGRRRDERSPLNTREDRRSDRSREEDRKKDDRDKRDKDRSLERRKDDKDNRRHDDRDRDLRDRDRDRDPKRMTREEREAAREKEREEALARCQERQRERERLKKLAEKEREMHMRNRDRERDRDRGLDRGLDKPTGDKIERLLPLPSERIPPAVRLQELAAERRSDRGTSKTGSDRLDRRDKSVDRGSDRSFSRGGLDRNSDRDRSDRGSDRMERLPPRDRRAVERNERGYDHSVERTYNRDLDRVYDRERDHERDGRRDRDYPPAPRSHDSDRRALIPDEKGYDSPYDNRNLRDERHYLEPEHERYDDPIGHRVPIDARDYPDDRRVRRDAWDDRVDPRDVREREMQHRVYPREGPAGGMKGRDWDKQEYHGGRHDWNERGSQSHDWEPHHDGWDQVERPVVEEEWHSGYDRSMDAWQNEDRRRNWPAEWQERAVPPMRIPQRPMKPMREEPHMHPIKDELHPDVRRNVKHIEHEPKVEIREPPEPVEDVKKEQPAVKRHAPEPPVDVPDAKKPCPDTVLEDDLSEISDDADEILNREDVEDIGSDFIDNVLTGFSEPAARHFEIPQEPPEVSAPVETFPEPPASGPVVQEEAERPASPGPPSTVENITSVDHHSVDEEGIDQMDFEEISDEELEEEVKVKGLGDALGVDWASLVAESRPRVKPVTSGSARKRWEPYRVLARIGVSVKMAGTDLADEIFSEIKVKTEEAESNEQKIETELDVDSVKKEPPDETCDKVKIEPPSDDVKPEIIEPVVEKVHPIAAVQVALKTWNHRRKALFADAGPFKRALSARKDLEIRRHLCKLPVKDTIGLGDAQPSHDPELFRLAVKIYERTL